MPSLRLTVERSPLLERLITALHLVAVICIWLAGIPRAAQLALSALVLAGLALRDILVRKQAGRDCLVFSEAAGWVLERQGRAPQPLIILPDSVVSPWLVILHGDDGCGTGRWAVARDSTDAESFRALRVTLNVMGIGDAATREGSVATNRVGLG